MEPLKMQFLLKLVIFHCHVGFPTVSFRELRTLTQNGLSFIKHLNQSFGSCHHVGFPTVSFRECILIGFLRVPGGYLPLIFPNVPCSVPQSSQTESLGFSSYSLPLNTPPKNPTIIGKSRDFEACLHVKMGLSQVSSGFGLGFHSTWWQESDGRPSAGRRWCGGFRV